MYSSRSPDGRYWESSQVEEDDSLIHRGVPNHEEDWTNDVQDCFATSLGKSGQCLPRITTEEVHCRSYSCARGGGCPSARGSWILKSSNSKGRRSGP